MQTQEKLSWLLAFEQPRPGRAHVAGMARSSAGISAATRSCYWGHPSTMGSHGARTSTAQPGHASGQRLFHHGSKWTLFTPGLVPGVGPRSAPSAAPRPRAAGARSGWDCAAGIGAWLAMNSDCLAAFSRLCWGQKDKNSSSSFSCFRHCTWRKTLSKASCQHGSHGVSADHKTRSRRHGEQSLCVRTWMRSAFWYCRSL